MTEENDLTKRFEGIFIAHYPAVKGFIAALLKSEAYAEDLAQDIFARLWTRRDIWAERDGGHSGYIYTMARNAALDFIRKRRKTSPHGGDFRPEALDGLFSENTPLDPLYAEEIQLLMELAIERLPKRRKRIFRMSRLDGMSNKEIAEALGLSTRTVEHQIYLALRELRRIIFLFLLLHLI